MWSLLGVLVGFGYRPFKVLIYVVAFIVTGAVLFGDGYKTDQFSPAKERVYMDGRPPNGARPLIDPTKVPRDYPNFSAIVYSIDTFFPIVNLHVEDYWIPDAERIYAEARKVLDYA